LFTAFDFSVPTFARYRFLAITDLMSQAKRPSIVVDDPFVHFDPVRGVHTFAQSEINDVMPKIEAFMERSLKEQ